MGERRDRGAFQVCAVSACLLLVVFALGMFSPKAPMTTTSTATLDRGPAVDQVVLVLVDALRPDFAVASLVLEGGGDACVEHPAPNKARYASATLTYIEEALIATVASPPGRPALGAFFIADAPTTTAQRLKALTTGVVPALMEAGSNFASDAIVEDSIIRQLHGSCAVLGDDTWLSLYPQSATSSSPAPNEVEGDLPPAVERLWRHARVFPSFQVDDLDTNDDGVLAAMEEFLNTGWAEGTQLILAHFLGVDHAGHTFHANHTLMHLKLAQLNVMLRGLSQYLTRRAEKDPLGRKTLLLVLGDHGMTNSGDHGGSSDLETDSFLFAEVFGSTTKEEGGKVIRSVTQHVQERWDRCDRTREDWDGTCRLAACSHALRGSPRLSAFRQVDLVPTLSWLMGTRIPFSNSGRPIKELMALFPEDGAGLETFLKENCEQLVTMLTQSGTAIGDDVGDACGAADGAALQCSDVPIGHMERCLASMSRAVRRATLHVRWPVVLASLCGACVCVLVSIALVCRGTVALSTLRQGGPNSSRSTGVQVAALLVVLPFVMIGLVALHFSNSFVVFEAPMVTSMLVLLSLALIPGVTRLYAAGCVVAIVFAHFVLPDGWRQRLHGTHHLLGVQSRIDGFLLSAFAAVGEQPQQATLAVDVAVWCTLAVSSLLLHPCAALAQPTAGVPSMYRRWGGDVFVASCWMVMKHLLGPHAAMAVALVRTSYHVFQRRSHAQHGTPRGLYIAFTLWLCALCDPLHPTWPVQIVAFSQLLQPYLPSPAGAVASAAHHHHHPIVVFAWPLAAFLFSDAAFFGHGQQNAFTSIDWTASTVGGGGEGRADLLMSMLRCSSALWWKGALVLLRTFGTSLLPLLAPTSPLSLGHAAPNIALSRVRVWRRWYVVLWVCKALCTSIAALVLRDHLMVVAIFGPNVLFCTLHAAVVTAAAVLMQRI